MWQLTTYCDAMPLLTQNVLGPQRQTPATKFRWLFTIRRQLIWLGSAPLTSFHLAKFGWAPYSPWAPIFWQERPQRFYERVLVRFTVHHLAKFG